MPYYSELQQRKIEDRNTSFEDKKLILKQKNKNMFYQLIKYLFNNHNDNSQEQSSGFFSVTTDRNRYVFPSPEAGSSFGEAISDEKNFQQLVYMLNSALIEIAEYNINKQNLADISIYYDGSEPQEPAERTDFERLDAIRHNTGPKRTGKEGTKKRKARFNKRVISPGLQSQLTSKGPNRIRLLLFAYALKMSAEETTALMQAVDPDQPINIWNGYEVIVFYAIVRNDAVLNDLDYLGQIMSDDRNDNAGAASLNSEGTDTELTWDSFRNIAQMDKKSSIGEMKKLLQNIKAAGKLSSIEARKTLNSMFEYVLKNADRIFKGSYGERCKLKEDAGDADFKKCRDALTEQFWPYYDNQIQFNREETKRQRDRLVLGYYLSRMKDTGIQTLGYENEAVALKNLDRLLNIKPGSVKKIQSMADSYLKNEADDKTLSVKNKKIFDKLEQLSDSELLTLVKNRIQYYEELKNSSEAEMGQYINLQEMRSLPTRKHLAAVDEEAQAVTRADLEFAFFLKFALDYPLTKYFDPENVDIDSLIQQRFSDYKLMTDQLLSRYHFEKAGAKYRFDDMLMVCMQKEYPVRELHRIAKEHFNISRDDVETQNI